MRSNLKASTMKKSIVLLIAGLTVLSAKAQQIPLYTQYYNNEFLYNPSQTLTEEYSSLDMFYRKQWILSASPLVTQGLVFQTPILTEKIGLGVNLINDKFGIFNRTGASMAYSYKVDLNEEHKLLLGLSAGFMNTNYDWNSDISLLGDPRFLEAVTDRVTSFDATFGFTYQWKALEVGMAVPHLLDNDLDFTVNTDDLLYFNYRHYVGNVSYQFDFGKFDLRPLLLVRYQPAVTPLFDMNVVAGYNDRYWAAVGYRHEGAMTFGAGANLHQRLKVGYSYDMNLNSDLNKYFGATHEITLGIRFGAGSPAPKPPIDPPGGGTDPGTDKEPLSLEDLQKQIDELKKQQEEQDSTILDHERRIDLLEKKMEQDSLQKTIENILLNQAIGSGSYDYRGNQMTISPGGRQIVNPTGPGRFGFDADGNEINPSSDYKGTVYYDKAATKPVADPQNPDVELYDVDGNRIEDITKHNGPVKDVRGNVVKDKKGNVIVMKNDASGSNSGSNNRNTGPIVRDANDPTPTDPNVPSYTKTQLITDGVRYTAPGNYVVVGSFRNKDYAIQLRERLQEKGYSAGIVYNHYRQWFYVYSIETNDFEQAIQQLEKEQAGDFSDAWLHVIIE